MFTMGWGEFIIYSDKKIALELNLNDGTISIPRYKLEKGIDLRKFNEKNAEKARKIIEEFKKTQKGI